MTACEAGRPAYSESWARCGRLSHVLAPSCTRRVARSPRQFSCMQRVWALCTRPHLHKVRQRATPSAAFEGHSSPRPSSHAAQPATYTPLVHNAAAVVALVASRLPPLVGIAPCAHVRVGASCTCTNKAGAAVCVRRRHVQSMALRQTLVHTLLQAPSASCGASAAPRAHRRFTNGTSAAHWHSSPITP